MGRDVNDFWSKFLDTVLEAGVSEKNAEWYVNWAPTQRTTNDNGVATMAT